jgi:hypothetical protein
MSSTSYCDECPSWFRILIGQSGSALAVTGAVEVGALCLPTAAAVLIAPLKATIPAQRCPDLVA